MFLFHLHFQAVQLCLLVWNNCILKVVLCRGLSPRGKGLGVNCLSNTPRGAVWQSMYSSFATCLVRLADFADLTKEVVTVGRTHYQTASLVTVGKRATIWAQDLLVAFKQVRVCNP